MHGISSDVAQIQEVMGEKVKPQCFKKIFHIPFQYNLLFAS